MSEFVKRLTAPTKDNAYYFANNIFYQCGYGMPNCFSGDTEFVTRDGIKTMKECLGKSIEVLDLDGNWRKATVEHFGKNELIKLEFGDGSTVLATPNHRWLVNKKSSYKDSRYSKTVEYETKDLKVSRNYNFPYIQRHPSDNVIYDELGVIHGFIFGDGGYYNNKKQSKANVCGDKQTFMCDLLKKYAKHSCESGNENGVIEYYPFPKEYKELPSIDSDEKYLLGFIIGLIASDDTVDSSVSISNKSESVLQYIKNICSVLKIRTGNVTKTVVKEKHCKGKIYENYSMYRISLCLSSMSPAMLLNPKHREIYNSTNKKNISYAHLKSITNTHIIDDVYCVVEPITHTFTLSNMVITRNCTAYAWGRMYELTNQYPRLSTGNAENWYIKNDGYQRGLTPKLGAIACWSKGVVGNGDDGAGHVAAVEEIKPDGTIVTSNSGWKSSYFYIKEIHPPYALSGYNFQGFIYCPIDFDSKPNVQPTPQNFKYNVGDKVIFSGTLYADSQGNGAGQSRSNLVATITLRANGSKPYNLDNGLGWVAESDLQLYKEPVKTALQVGDTVKIIGYGNSQADGRGITAGGIGWTRTVIRILPNTANPYCIGSGNVATGWYPENSLQKL